MSEQTYTKADLDAAIAEANRALEANRDAIKEELKQLRKVQTVTPEAHAALQDENEKLQAALVERDRSIKTLTGERDKLSKTLESESGFTAKLLIQDGIKSALIANGVKDEDYLDALVTKFSNGAAVVADGDTRKAMMGDKAVADAIKEWAGSDAGKKFVAAPVNGGGGAPGSQGNGGAGKTISRAQFDGMDAGARMAFATEGGKVVDQAA